jgi:hypothetical protein
VLSLFVRRPSQIHVYLLDGDGKQFSMPLVTLRSTHSSSQRVTTESGLQRPDLPRSTPYDPESASCTATFCSTPVQVSLG